MSDNNFCGEWDLIPELSLYDQGHGPMASQHSISVKDDVVSIAIITTQADQQCFTVKFGGHMDGSLQEVNGKGITHTNFTKINDNGLENCGFCADVKQLHTTRQVSADGQLMSLNRRVYNDGNVDSHFQVFRRAATPNV